MGYSKRQLEEKADKKVDVAAKKASKKSATNYVDMRPDATQKEASIAVLERFEDFFEKFGIAFSTHEMAFTLKWQAKQSCWVGTLSNVNEKWPNITYYTFRHSSPERLLAHLMYTVVDEWQGMLPREDIVTEDINW